MDRLTGAVCCGLLAGMLLASGCAVKRELAPPAPVDNTGYFLERGNSCLQKGDLERALSFYTKIIETNPAFSSAYFNRGNVYFKKGLYDEALLDYNKALELEPGLAEAYKQRGMIHNHKNESNRAIEDYNKALALNPNDIDVYLDRGDAYFRKNMYDRAVVDYEKIIIINPKHADAYFRKAVTCELLGRNEEAAEAYAAFLQHAPTHSGVKVGRANERLRSLQKKTAFTTNSGLYKNP